LYSFKLAAPVQTELIYLHGATAANMRLPDWHVDTKEMELKIKRKFGIDAFKPRAAERVALFCQPFVPFLCALRDDLTCLLGSVFRLSRDGAFKNPVLQAKLDAFTQKAFATDLACIQPLPSTVDVSRKTWMADTSYTLEEKAYFDSIGVTTDQMFEHVRRVVRNRNNPFSKWKPVDWLSWTIVGGFPKEEFYTVCDVLGNDPYTMEDCTVKFARGINARDDVFKCWFGPYEKVVSKMLYEHSAFVKNVPVCDRPDYIRSTLKIAAALYADTDVSSFEAIFTKFVMEVTSIRMYSIALRNLPDYRKIMYILRNVLTGKNMIRYKHFTMIVEAVRMSGEMDTSSANGLSNVLLQLFLYWLREEDEARMCEVYVEGGFKQNPVLVAEGDDGINRARGRLTSVQDYAAVGIKATGGVSDDPTTMQFCGIRQTRSGVNCKSIQTVLAKFCWLPSRYVRSKKHLLETLYRAKAYSLMYECTNCPVLHEFALAVLRLSNHTHNRVRKIWFQFQDRYHAESLLPALDMAIKQPSIDFVTRVDCERWYGVSVAEQLSLEAQFRAAKNWSDLRVPDMRVPPLWRYMNQHFVSKQFFRDASSFPSTRANLHLVETVFDMVPEDGFRPSLTAVLPAVL
jgi:hypothetical protein